jgi:hypothetical protein
MGVARVGRIVAHNEQGVRRLPGVAKGTVCSIPQFSMHRTGEQSCSSHAAFLKKITLTEAERLFTIAANVQRCKSSLYEIRRESSGVGCPPSCRISSRPVRFGDSPHRTKTFHLQEAVLDEPAVAPWLPPDSRVTVLRKPSTKWTHPLRQ